jgi:hypothetical protein
VHAGDELNDSITFEIPTHAHAKRLVARLRESWRCDIDFDGPAWSVVAELGAERRDLALLFGEVLAWLEVSGLGAMRVHVDGREYVLVASEPVAHRVEASP